MEFMLVPYLLAFFLASTISFAIRKLSTSWFAQRAPRVQVRAKREPLEPDPTPSGTDRERECQPYKQLYYKLHNLEQHPQVLPQVRLLLFSFLSEALPSGTSPSSIVALDRFSANALDRFVQQELDAVTTRWQDYLRGRKEGQPRMLFQSAADARRWLVRIAPAKLVDGAWLGHIHKITTPFAHRRTTRAAWQVLSEELGDGDLVRNHTHLFAQLLERVGVPVGEPDSIDFTRHPGMDDAQIWRSALVQLLISLFPHEFLLEILGFNLHFEMLTLDTLVATKELREIGYDPYYFTLHVTIDNASTGHTAMASHIVTDYLRSVEARQGEVAAHQAWRRVQAGYMLSKNSSNIDESTGYPLVAEVLAIFREKVAASNRIHDDCPVRFGGRSLSSWLEPEAFSRAERQADFLRCLSNAKPWVYRGNSKRSRLIRQLSWGGSMFGAFSDREVAVLRDWVDCMVPPGAERYKAFTGRTDMVESPSRKLDLRVDHPVFTTTALSHMDIAQAPVSQALNIDMSKVNIHRLLPLWFAHPCLLESFICIPWKTASPMGCAIVRFLRAQYGFLPEPVGVAGIDETRRIDYMDLVDIGMEMLPRAEPPSLPPNTLADVLERWPSPFADTMLATAMRPLEHGWVLLGMAHAFVQLHSSLALSLPLLSPRGRAALGIMAQREKENLGKCIERLNDGKMDMGFWKGYVLARQEIEECFRE